MKNQKAAPKTPPKQISMLVGGRQVICTFADQPNLTLPNLIRDTLLESYIRKLGGNVGKAPTDAYSILSECAACQ